MTSVEPPFGVERSSWMIYGLRQRDTVEIRYVGKTTTTGRVRMSRHLAEARTIKNPRYVHNWMTSIGLEFVEMVLIQQCVEGDNAALDAAETHWISRLRSEGHALTNLTDGGEGTSGYKLSEAQKKQISVRMKGRYVGDKNHRFGIKGELHPMFGVRGPDHPGYGYKAPPERLAQMSKISTGRRHSQDAKDKISRANKGVPKSQETRDKISLSTKGKVVSPETRHKIHLYAHKRYHTDRGIVNPTCVTCVKESK